MVQTSSNLTTRLQAFVARQNLFQQHFGQILAWGLLSLVLISASIVILRYGFDIGSIALQETALYNHAIIFMLGFAYTLQQNEHVRVDIFYAQLSKKRKAWVDLIGGLIFALPVMIFIALNSWQYVANSWRIFESSAEAGGLPFVYLLKSVILIMLFLLTSQIISDIVKSFLTIKQTKTTT